MLIARERQAISESMALKIIREISELSAKEKILRHSSKLTKGSRSIDRDRGEKLKESKKNRTGYLYLGMMNYILKVVTL